MGSAIGGVGPYRPLKLLPDHPSKAEPGRLCIAAEIDTTNTVDLEITMAEWFEELLHFNKYPVAHFQKELEMVKSVELEEHGPNDFTVKVILDGRKLDAAGLGRGDGVDKIPVWMRFIFASMALGDLGDSPKVVMMSARYLHYVDAQGGGAWADQASDDEIVAQSTLYGFGNHMEYCMDRGDTRLTSKQQAEYLLTKFDTFFGGWKQARLDEIQVARGATSIHDGMRKSNVSGSLDKYLCYDDLFDALIAVLQEKVGSSMLDLRDSSSFVGEAWQRERLNHKIRAEVQFSKEKGEIRVLEVAVTDQGLAWPAWSMLTQCIVHREPLRAESWIVEDDRQVSNLYGARRLQTLLNAAAKRSNPKGGDDSPVQKGESG